MEISDEDAARIQEKVDKLKASKFKQQNLPAWRPVPSFGSTMVIFGIFGVVFLTLGVTLYVMSDKIQDSVKQYDNDPLCSTPEIPPFAGGVNPNTCTVKLNIDTDIEGPVYVYYQLENFYQNHRRYVKSRSNEQLLGKLNPKTKEDIDTDLSDCSPILTNAQAEVTKSVNGLDLDPEAAAYPCGLVAKSVFNDTYQLYSKDPATDSTFADSKVNIDDSDIAWESDRQYKFFNLPADSGEDWESVQWLDVQDQHFIVWMRTAGLPNFRKLYGVIPEGLLAGTYYLQVENNYDVGSFTGHKYFVISTTNLLGGQNYFLAICYIIVGALCLMFGIIFFIAYMNRKSQTNRQSQQAAPARGGN